MEEQHGVAEHYTHGTLIDAITSAIGALGKTTDNLTVDDLAAVDEFHIGGRKASEDFLTQLSLSPDRHVIDIGCGLGGAARFAASRFGCQLTGMDLTKEYIETGRILSSWVGLDDLVTLHHGSALSMPFDDGAFNAGYMLHVGMNIEDKAKLFSEIYRVLQPGSMFGVYDVMQTGEGDLTYPVPWATTAATSAVAAPAMYKAHLEAAGLAIVAERNRRDFALEFFDQLRAKTQAAGGPPPLGLHILMGHNTPDKVQNMISNISAGRIAPVELIARK
jgi:ubiquinone/menaquinone biosynthesis C-methylase UbiE